MTDSPPVDLTDEFDVVIAGAGLSGLTAARELLQRCPELKVLVVEPKDRVGGRLLTVPVKVHKNKTEMFDLGGQWVCRHQLHSMDLLNELNIPTYEQYGEGYSLGQFGTAAIRQFKDDLPISSIRKFGFSELMDIGWNTFKIERLVNKVDLHDVFKNKDVGNLDDYSVSKWAKENAWSRTARDILDTVMLTIYGVDSSKINMLFHLIYSKSAGSFLNLCEHEGDGGQALKIKGGSQQLCTRLFDQLPEGTVVFGEAITEIEIHEETATSTVHLKTTSGEHATRAIKCSRVILAIPPNQVRKISFSPRLPYLKNRLYEYIVPGHYLKFIVTYETAFWKEQGLSGNIISTGKTEIPGEKLPIILTYDATTVGGAPAIVGFLNEEYTDMTVEQRCNEVVKDLVRFFGDRALNEFVDYKDKVWAHEPYNEGCPVCVIAPGNMDSWQVIREPHHTVHFAGTETALTWMGYMNGAIESGLRTSHEVLHCLEKHNAVCFNYLEGSIFDSDYKPPLPPSNEYSSMRSPWWRRMFFTSVLVFGIYAYSQKYRLSYTAKAMKPVENTLIRWTTGIIWPE